MISRLRGRVIEKTPTYLVVDVGGVGYLVSVPVTASAALAGDEAELFIQTEVREDAIQLFGFVNREDRELFRLLRDIQGIGPQTALAILSSISPEDFCRAVREQNPGRFTGIPRVGRKTAERILLELREKKLSFVESYSPGGLVPGKPDVFQDAVAALESLGYKTSEANKVVGDVVKETPEAGTEDLVRLSLKRLSP
ncbi:MAG TPA: Holliday junction branch migration protein RuvA [Acidobacteriota bacterium]|jgi:Holliday junction DNA helicase RuvA|nr:Holliday junction branch migration protein RuvA [Acidobacteriota bacterium]HNT16808.1 Holliday junction branch migration protein RuvA [Acidobacteriota bacterium]HPA26933.1 Holliday junction branch migration protein RuvA [Acidobacteriota bacterium]HQO19351.1 Holliday junction branch migration protein RuvA [Acidobacteriota bacterium]HQQ47388.1 Holliday junction branch migration protein RuvA [Acidobacteriota bacterium]